VIPYEVLAQGRVRFYPADCLKVAETLPTSFVDCVVTDPPYPGIDRKYGVWSVDEWFDLMNPLVQQIRQVLKPHGSAVFVLQPNFEKIGRMSSWLWEWMAFWAERFPNWGIVQDVYWWNTTALPTANCQEVHGLLRSSLKYCVWMGPADCYRDQSAVLWTESQAQRLGRSMDRVSAENGVLKTDRPSGHTVNFLIRERSAERGGVTPFNVIPVGNSDSATSAGAYGHGAGTPRQLARWWIRYLTRPGGIVWDPFAGSGTMGLEAVRMGRRAILCEKHPPYQELIRERFSSAIVEDQLI
jgi:DNA modification methylase